MKDQQPFMLFLKFINNNFPLKREPTNFKQQKSNIVTLGEARQASDILQRINIANETISRLKLNDIESISFNKISGNVFIGELRLVNDLKEYFIDILKEEVNILTKN